MPSPPNGPCSRSSRSPRPIATTHCSPHLLRAAISLRWSRRASGSRAAEPVSMPTSATREALADTQLRQWTGTIASPKGIVGWAFQYDDSRISYDNLNSRLDQNSTLYRGRLFFEPEPELRLSVSAGRENNNYSLQQDRRHYDLYGAGLSWRPGGRTSAEFEWERRFFGPSPLAKR